MLVDRQIQSEITPELHSWILKFSTGTRRSFDHHGKGNGNVVFIYSFI